MAKLAYIDLETTGLSPRRNAIIQIGLIIEINGVVRESTVWHVAPSPDDEIDENALSISDIRPEDLLDKRKYVPAREVWTKLMRLFNSYVDPYDKQDKFHFVGYNSHTFDMPFLREFWKKQGDVYFGSWFWYPSIDVMLVAAHVLADMRHCITSFKLLDVARACDLEIDEAAAHDAMYDIKLTRELYHRLLRRPR